MMKSKNLQYAFYVEYYEKLPEILKKQKEFKEKPKKQNNSKKEKNSEAVDYRQMNQEILNIARETSSSMQKFSEYKEELSVLEFTSSYPGILVGTGYNHKVKGKGEIGMGFTFDYVTGLPYLPGSSLKGILRFGFRQEEYIHEVVKDVLHTELSDGEINELTNTIFEGADSRKKFVFYDATISHNEKGKSLLALDTITPHTKDGLKEPNPITFLRICPDIKIHFEFQLYEVILSTGKHVSKDNIKEIFKNILEDLGIGAKTNVGYGVLESVENKEDM